MKKFISEFKAFATKGNVIDLAIGIVIGGAFGKIVSSLVSDIVMPSLSFMTGKINISNLKQIITPASEKVPELAIKYGSFFQSIIDFTIIAFCIFLMVKIITVFKKKDADKPTEPSKEEVLLAEIRDLLKKKDNSILFYRRG